MNFAYDGGVHVYSSYFVLLAGFLLVDDIPKLYDLLVRERYTVPSDHYPSFSAKWLKYTRIGLKSATIFVFLILLFYLQVINFRYDPYKQPAVAGLRTLRGTYAVTEFRLNNRIIPYSPLDTLAWHEAEFEKWSSLSYTVNRPTALDLSNGGGDPQRDVNRNFEISGVAGGRHVFHYYADTVDKVLYLEDKFKAIPDRRNRAAGVGGDGGSDVNLSITNNRAPRRHAADVGSEFDAGVEKGPGRQNTDKHAGQTDNWIPKEALAHIGDEVNKIDPRAASSRRDREYAEAPKREKRNRMILKYDTVDGSRVVLTGINENKDSIYVVLDKVNKDFTLSESSLASWNLLMRALFFFGVVILLLAGFRREPPGDGTGGSRS